MIVISEGESLRVPATVVGAKNLIQGLEAQIKKSLRGEVPSEDTAVASVLLVSDYTSDEITDGYIFTLTDTSSLGRGTYYINFKFVVDGYTYKGDPLKVLIKEGVL